MLLVFLVTFVIVPAAFFFMGTRRKDIDEPNLQECPSCGAENHQAKERCYCCGYHLAAAPGEAILQRVKQADESRTKSRAATKSPQIVDD